MYFLLRFERKNLKSFLNNLEYPNTANFVF